MQEKQGMGVVQDTVQVYIVTKSTNFHSRNIQGLWRKLHNSWNLLHSSTRSKLSTSDSLGYHRILWGKTHFQYFFFYYPNVYLTFAVIFDFICIFPSFKLICSDKSLKKVVVIGQLIQNAAINGKEFTQANGCYAGSL